MCFYCALLLECDHDEGNYMVKHVGFKGAQSKVEKEGYSKKESGAIIAASSRHASKAAHKANPRLNRVKGK